MRNSRLVTAAFAVLAAASAHGADKLRVGYLPVTGHAKFFVAQEQGFFAAEGLEVELVQFVNSADGTNALNAGKLDVGAFGTTAPLVHISKGTDLRIIGGVMGEDVAIVTTQAGGAVIKSVADLKGKRIATVRLATGDAVLRGALHDAGLDWRKDVTIFELKNPPAVIEAVKTAQVDAGVVWGPHDLRAVEDGLVVLVRSKALQPGHPCCRLTVRAELLKERSRWVRLVRAILRAEKFTREDHPKTVEVIAKYLKLDPALVERAYYGGHLEQGTDPNVHGVVQFWKVMQESGFVDSKEDIRAHVDATIYKEALDSLAKESPKDPYWIELNGRFAARNL